MFRRYPLIKQQFYELYENEYCFNDKYFVVLNKIGNGIVIKEANRKGQSKDCIYSGS